MRPSISTYRGFGWSAAIVGNDASDRAMGDEGEDNDHRHLHNATEQRWS